jgi:hypothetical protein
MIFPVLEIEDIVQENDKTRLNGLKSFVSDGAAITKVEIKPSKVNDYQTVTANKYLDWMYDSEIHVDAANNKIDFSESDVAKVAILSLDSYTLEDLATELELRLNDAGANTYTVSVSNGKITIAADGAFDLLVETGDNVDASVFADIGFTGDDREGKATYTGSKVEYVTREVTIRVTTGVNPSEVQQSLIKTLRVISEENDNLYSTDAQLQVHEPGILKYARAGRASLLDLHRRAQELILAHLDKNGYVDYQRRKLTKASLVLTDEVKEWSTFIALRLVMEGVSNDVDDIFHEKADGYRKEEVNARDRAVLRLDLDGDGEATDGEEADITSALVVRR